MFLIRFMRVWGFGVFVLVFKLVFGFLVVYFRSIRWSCFRFAVSRLLYGSFLCFRRGSVLLGIFLELYFRGGNMFGVGEWGELRVRGFWGGMFLFGFLTYLILGFFFCF